MAKNHLDGCSDDGPGTPAQPWCTIGRATALVNPGDVVLIREGICTEIVDITRSGSPNTPITWLGEKNGSEFLTIIDPGVPVTSGWVPAPEVGSGVFKHSSLPFVPYVVRDNDLQIGHNVLRDLYARGSTTAVALNGTSAHDNVVEGCRLRHGQGMLVLSAGVRPAQPLGWDHPSRCPLRPRPGWP